MVRHLKQNRPSSIQDDGWCVCLNPFILSAVKVYCQPSPFLPVCGVQMFLAQDVLMAG